jgi:predicted phosphoribosyltransferase
VLVARKIGHPASPEYGVGAVTARGHLVANEREKASLGAEWFARAAERESAIAQEQLCRYAGSAKQAELAGKTAVVVDDGIATGYTLRAAVLDIRERNPSRIIVAVPVAPSGVQQHLAFDVDEWVILHQPEFGFGAVGTYYEDFRPVTDEAVLAALDACGQ